LKLQAERRPRPFLRLAFPDSDFKVIASKYNTELIIKTRRVDKVIHIADADGEHLINYEFQSRYRRTTAKRMFVYAGALTATHNLEVSSVLFLLRPPPKNVRTLGRYEVKLFKQRTNTFEFIVVKLWELRDEILAGKKEYLPFVPFLLYISPKPSIALLRKQRELINLERNPERRAELAGFSALLARRYFARELIRTILMQEKQTMSIDWEEVPVIGDRIKEKVTEGQAQTLQKTIMEVLAMRFDVANGKIARLVNSIHQPQKLEVIFRRALRAKSLDTVITMLQQAKPQTKRKPRK
jgi:hypothetical protein